MEKIASTRGRVYYQICTKGDYSRCSYWHGLDWSLLSRMTGSKESFLEESVSHAPFSELSFGRLQDQCPCSSHKKELSTHVQGGGGVTWAALPLTKRAGMEDLRPIV